MKKILFFFLITISISLSGQPENKLTGGYTPATPEAYAQGKYADIPVNLSNGVASTSIPLGSIIDGPLSLDISLNYHLGGTRLEEVSSWVGHGWSLNAGGMISRTVLGLPDDTNGAFKGYYYFGSQLRSPFPFLDFFDTETQDQVLEAHEGGLDSEPDIFTFNFNGYSGKYIFNSSGEPIQLTKSDLKITPTKFRSSRFVEFEIITPDGVRYYFGSEEFDSAAGTPVNVEKITTPSIPNFNNHYYSSWYLTRVISPDDNHEIYLEYDYEGEISYFSKPTGTGEYLIHPWTCCDDPPVFAGAYPYGGLGPCKDTNADFNGMPVENRYKKWRLRFINSTYQEISFVANNMRKDLPGAKRLDEIQFVDFSGNAMSRKFKFGYTSIEADTEGENFITPDVKYKLRLENLKEVSWDETSIVRNPYIFEYYEGDLPRRTSYAVDHWGFYNGSGNANGTKNFGGIPPYPLYNSNFNTATFTGKRMTDENSMLIGNLKKITYPYGGSREFVLEANKALIEECPGSLPYSLYPVFSLVTCNGPFSEECCTGTKCSSGTYIHGSKPITDYEFRLSGTRTQSVDNDECDCDGSLPFIGEVEVVVKDNDGNEINYFEIYITEQECDNSFKDVEGELAEFFIPEVGKEYTIEICSEQYTFGQFYIYERIKDCPVELKDVGGLRVKKIIESPGIGEEKKVIQYEYLDEDSQPSGVLFNEPQYGGILQEYLTGFYLFVKVTSSSYFPLSSFQSNIVTYKHVNEIIEGKGRTVYDFNIENQPEDEYYGRHVFPSKPNLTTLLNGSLKQKTFYNEKGQEVYKEVIEYEDPEYKDIDGSAYKTDGSLIYHVGGLCPRTAVVYYKNRYGHKRVKSKTIIKDGVENKQSFFYDFWDKFQMPSSKEFTNSKNQICRTEYKYIHYSANIPIRNSLLEKNIISNPWQTLKFVDGKEVSGLKYDYEFYNNFPRVSSISHYLNGWNERAVIKDYDSEGNVKIYAQTGWSDEVFTWDPGSRLRRKKYEKFITDYNYFPDSKFLSEIISIDELSTFYDYDGLQRLENISQRDGLINTSYDYHDQNASDPFNWVKATNSFSGDQGDSKTLIAKSIINGLGSEIQKVKCSYSPNGKDIYQSVDLDVFNKPEKTFQPVEGNNSCDYYSSNSGDYWETTYESSPLSRQIFSRLSSWPAGVGTIYDCNSSEDEVKIYNAGCGSNSTGVYPSCSLYKVINVDENGKPTEIYTDKLGRQILIRKFIGRSYSSPLSNPVDKESSTNDSPGGTQKVDTYNVYDDIGNLVLVISPEGAEGNSGDVNYCYEYDDLNRVIMKDLPGSGPSTMGYYDNDLLKWETDAKGNTINYVYDVYGRLNKKFLGGTFVEGIVVGGSLIMEDVYFSENSGTQFVTQLKTSSSATVSGDNRIGPLLTTHYKGYDSHTRLLRSTSTNNVGGQDVYSYTYADHADNIQSLLRRHTGYESVDILESFNYDHSLRQKTHTYSNSISGSTQLLNSKKYTYKDELESKTIGGLAKLDYQYNTRSWLTDINSLGTSLPFEDFDCVPEIPFDIDLDIIPYIPCDDETENPGTVTNLTDNVTFEIVDCDLLPECSEFGPSDEILINDFIAFISTITADNMGYPQKLRRVRFCDGREIYITDSDILHAQINGVSIPVYIVLQEICIITINDPVTIIGPDGNDLVVPFHELIDILNTGSVPQVEGYPECGEEITCTYSQVDFPISVTRDYEKPNCNVEDIYNNGELCSISLFNDPDSDCYLRHTNVCFGFETFDQECEDLQIESVSFIIDYTIDSCDDVPFFNQVVIVGDKEFPLAPIITINTSSSIDDLCIELPPYYYTSECNMCVFSVHRVTNYTCDCSTEDPTISEAGEPSCECLIDETEDPCIDILPDCTDEEIAEQEEYIDDLIEWAANVAVSEVELPIEMCRTTLCDGRQISIPVQYLEENPLPGPHDCETITSTQEPPPDNCIISNPIFAMKFSYNNPNGSYSGAEPQYNGNISQIEQQLAMKHIEGINYQYDQLDRLTEQDYWWKSCKNQYWNNKFYNVEDITYDLNGNMKTIKRYSKPPLRICDPKTGLIDNLTMNYSGNQLTSVTDGSTLEPEMGYVLGDNSGGYGYDASGNMTTIGNKPFTLGYNFLNLPSTMAYGDPGGNGEPLGLSTSSWTYTSDGIKLKYQDREYADGIEYKNGKLYAIHHAEGRVFPKPQTESQINNNEPLDWQFEYYIKDHLGNTRIVLDEGGIPIQENNYYPFGMNMENIDAIPDDNEDTRYLYNGKEMNEDLGWLDYGFRFYDPSICRFTTIDPLAELMPSWSPYSYVFNNPMIFIDPTGMAPEWIDNEDGTYTAEAGDSANSLSKDANITLEEADAIVQEQYGPNYKGADGEMKSNVDPGDVVDVCCTEKNDIKQASLDKQDEIAGNETQISETVDVVDSLNGANTDIMNEKLEMLNSPLNKSEPGDPGGIWGPMRTIKSGKFDKAIKKNNAKINSANNKVDSLKKVNQKLKNER